jgi:transposase
MSDPELLTVSEPPRRLEIFTGAGRRRTSSPETKARIVAESQAAGASVCAVARRHGLTPQLFTWRREPWRLDGQGSRSPAAALQSAPPRARRPRSGDRFNP